LASNGIDPIKDVKTIVVPPPQMVANMRIGNMDGYCVGEPWNARAIYDKVGYTVATSQDIWADHPEKVLGTTAEFVAKNPNTARAMIMAILEASKYIEATANRAKVAELISGKAFVNAPKDVILGRFIGDYDNGIGKKWKDPNFMKFYADGAVSYPYLSDGMWFLTQHKRWGMLKSDPDYLAIAKKVNQIELYSQAASQVGVSVPKEPMRSSKLMDGTVWDGKDPKAYAASFKLRA
jgi:nitrate/nitrite transport system substrate-binding protein